MDGVFGRQLGLPKQLPGDPALPFSLAGGCALLGGMALLATRSTVSLPVNEEACEPKETGFGKWMDARITVSAPFARPSA